MGLFEDVVENARVAVNAVGQKAGQIIDISKLRMNAAELNNEISKRFESLGRLMYDAYKTENSPEELVQECISVIEQLYEQLDDINEQIAIAKNRIKCKHCGFENIQEAIYCNRCGAKLVAEPEAPAKKETPPEPVTEEPATQTLEKEENTPVDIPVGNQEPTGQDKSEDTPVDFK